MTRTDEPGERPRAADQLGELEHQPVPARAASACETPRSAAVGRVQHEGHVGALEVGVLERERRVLVGGVHGRYAGRTSRPTAPRRRRRASSSEERPLARGRRRCRAGTSSRSSSRRPNRRPAAPRRPCWSARVSVNWISVGLTTCGGVHPVAVEAQPRTCRRIPRRGPTPPFRPETEPRRERRR